MSAPEVDLTYTATAPRAGEAQVTREGDTWVVYAVEPIAEDSCCMEPARLVVGDLVGLTREAPGRWRVSFRGRGNITPGCIVGCPDPAPWEIPDYVLRCLGPDLRGDPPSEEDFARGREIAARLNEVGRDH